MVRLAFTIHCLGLTWNPSAGGDCLVKTHPPAGMRVRSVAALARRGDVTNCRIPDVTKRGRGKGAMIFNVTIGLVVAWWAARRWSRLNGGVFLSCFLAFVMAWFGGGALSIVFSSASHSEAAMRAMTHGLWFALIGAGIGGGLGWLHWRRDCR